ncbi:MAG: PKD domain-containing protein [Bacteroidetes bacterium]|nr:PKD domain-containing protein [Bacteroidota bacterium]
MLPVIWYVQELKDLILLQLQTHHVTYNQVFWAYKNGLDVNFSNLTTCPNCASQSFEWSFGDGSPNSILLNPSHTYANLGLYQACLYASGIDSLQNTCTDTFCLDIVFNYPNLVLDEKPNTINIFPNPVHHQLFIVNT